MKKKFSDEKAVELIFEFLQKLKRGETSFEAFAVGVAMVIAPVPLSSEDIEWATQTAKSLGFEAVEHTLAPDVCRGCGANLKYTTAFENNVPVCDACGTRR